SVVIVAVVSTERPPQLACERGRVSAQAAVNHTHHGPPQCRQRHELSLLDSACSDAALGEAAHLDDYFKSPVANLDARSSSACQNHPGH
ncbi:hypothetical protein BaRGS_00033903, partial [Batillaria attramentaria]